MTRNGDVYSLTYDDSDLPSHYGWKVSSHLDRIEAEYNRLKENGPQPPKGPSERALESRVRSILADLDDQGRWLRENDGSRLIGQAKFPPNTPFLSSELFSRNVETLSQYLKATRPR